MNRLRCLLLCAWLLCNPAAAQDDKPEVYYDSENIADDEKVWQEKASSLPPYPDLNKLQYFYVGPTTTLEFAIEPASLQIGEDEVVRYTMVVKSRSGALNVSHEGLRCKTYELKVYAYGHHDGQSWMPTRKPVWKAIVETGANRPHAMLGRDYFCQQGALVSRDAKVLLKRLKTGLN